MTNEEREMDLALAALLLALEALEYMNVTAERYVDKQIPENAIACLRLVIDAENISSKPMAWEQFYPEMGKPKLAYLSPTESPENACYIPPQRTWVGLTKDEVFAVSNTMPYGDRFDFAEAIEAKLKEKNNG